ncbi:rhomboid family intramembrane serine protease [Flavobacterium pedocola]
MDILDDLKLQYRTGGITLQLIFWNVGIAIPFFIFNSYFRNIYFLLADWLALSSSFQEFAFKPWTFFSYAFLHAGVGHLLFNMLVLFMSGRLFLTYFTQKQFLGVYFIGAFFSGLAFVISSFLLHVNGTLIGASGAIMAILFVPVCYAPTSEVKIPLIGYVKLWHIGFVLLFMDLIQIPMENTGGHIAHLGGAFFGFLYVKLLRNGTDLSKIVSNIIDYFVTLFRPRKSTPFKKVHRNTSTQTKNQPKPQKDFTQQQIDDILDKISKSGYDSLTKEEKEFLFKVGKDNSSSQ